MLRYVVPIATLAALGCAPTGTGCYAFSWLEFEQAERVPVWLVPDGVRLEAEGAGGGWYVAQPVHPLPENDVAAGQERGWAGVLFDRQWQPDGDTLRIVLQDIGYNRWDIALTDHDDGWNGAAIFTTTMGGGERSYSGVLQATACTEETP